MFSRVVKFGASAIVIAIPFVAFGSTNINKQDIAKQEQKIASEEKQLVLQKKTLEAEKLKLGIKDKKTTKASATSSTAKPTSHWAGSNAQLGLVLNTGNTESTNFSSGINLLYKRGSWANTAQLQLQLNRSQGLLTKERYYAADQAQYSFSKQRKNYVYGNVNFTDDQFSPYEFQVISSVGYGRDLIKTARFTLNVQAGPGLRFDDIRSQAKNQKNFIVYTASNITWQVTKSMKFTEQLQYTLGNPYNYLQSVSAITNKLIGNLALQVSYTLQYYSEIPLDSTNTKKLDTTTNLALVYNF